MPFKSDETFEAIKAGVAGNGAEAVKRVNAVIQYNVSRKEEKKTWTLDLKNGDGAVYEGAPRAGKADVEISVSDSNFHKLAQGKGSPQALFMAGKLKLKGDFAAAMKMQSVLENARKQQPSKL